MSRNVRAPGRRYRCDGSHSHAQSRCCSPGLLTPRRSTNAFRATVSATSRHHAERRPEPSARSKRLPSRHRRPLSSPRGTGRPGKTAPNPHSCRTSPVRIGLRLFNEDRHPKNLRRHADNHSRNDAACQAAKGSARAHVAACRPGPEYRSASAAGQRRRAGMWAPLKDLAPQRVTCCTSHNAYYVNATA